MAQIEFWNTIYTEPIVEWGLYDDDFPQVELIARLHADEMLSVIPEPPPDRPDPWWDSLLITPPEPWESCYTRT